MNEIEDIKREHFCQIIGEIYGSDEYLVVGIDVAKEKHHAFMGVYDRNIFQILPY